MRKLISLALLIALYPAAGATLAQVAPPAGAPKFLQLPFDENAVRIEQGWYYDEGNINLGCIYSEDIAVNSPRHCGIDYFLRNSSGAAVGFSVYAAASGLVTWGSTGSGTGNYVAIKHDQKYLSRNYCTRYLHMGSFSKELTRIKKNSRIDAGFLLGVSGKTGVEKYTSNPIVHLHFEVGLADANGNCTTSGREYFDPYDIASGLLKRNKAPTADFYPQNNTGRKDQFGGCGPNFLFQECPPKIKQKDEVATVLCTNSYLTPGPVPANFGVPFNLFESNKLSVSGSCRDDQFITLSLGTGSDAEYIYKNGYRFLQGRWVPISFTGGTKSGDWFKGKAEARIRANWNTVGDANYVVGYICTWNDERWKCGCRDRQCSSSMWQLQAVRQSRSSSEQGLAAID